MVPDWYPHLIRQHFLYSVGAIGVRVAEQMAVHVERDRGLGMTEATGDCHHVLWPFRSKSKSPARIGPPPSKTYALIRSPSFLPWVGPSSPTLVSLIESWTTLSLVGRHPPKFEVPRGVPSRRRFSRVPKFQANPTKPIRDKMTLFRAFRHPRPAFGTLLFRKRQTVAEHG
jgi:hypothetical protein